MGDVSTPASATGVPIDDKALIRAALAARQFAWAPYSNFMVGAAVLTTSGKIYTGCNIESASYSPTNCGERTAIFKAVSEGERDFAAIAIVGGPRDSAQLGYAYPCGVCRQFIYEFGTDILVICAKGPDSYYTKTISEMLPHGFGPSHLK